MFEEERQAGFLERPYNYGSLELVQPGADESMDESWEHLSQDGMSTRLENATPHRRKMKRRWSVLQKLEEKHYCRVRSCADCVRICNCKCMLATCMLATFVILAFTFARVFFFATELGFIRFDYIIVGGSPSGSIICRRLVESGAKVLMIEAGNNTQYELDGGDYFAGPVSRFDIPRLWSTIPDYEDFSWDGFEDTHISLSKGIGGSGIRSAMLYLRALPADIARWDLPGWNWPTMLELYKCLEWFDAETKSKGDGGIAGIGDISDYHGSRGLIRTAFGSTIDPLSELFLQAATQAEQGEQKSNGNVDRKLKKSDDFNNPNHARGDSAGRFHFNIARGIRDSAALQFLAPILGDPGLQLEVRATATRILMAPGTSTGQVVGKGEVKAQNLYLLAMRA